MLAFLDTAPTRRMRQQLQRVAPPTALSPPRDCAHNHRTFAHTTQPPPYPHRLTPSSLSSHHLTLTSTTSPHHPPPNVRWADIELSGGQVLELIEYIDPRGAPSRPAANDPGATHISLRVGDIEAIHGRLRQAGVPVRTDPIELTAPGAWQGARCFYASDPDGVTVELIQV